MCLTRDLHCAGVTAIRPDELEFPNTMTDIDYDTWMLRYKHYLLLRELLKHS